MIYMHFIGLLLYFSVPRFQIIVIFTNLIKILLYTYNYLKKNLPLFICFRHNVNKFTTQIFIL